MKILNKKIKYSKTLLKKFYGRYILENLKKFDFFSEAKYQKFFLLFDKSVSFHDSKIIYQNLNLTFLIFHSFTQCDIFTGEILYDSIQVVFKYQKNIVLFSKNFKLSNNLGVFLLQKFTIERKSHETRIFFFYFPLIFLKLLKFENFFFFLENFFSIRFFSKKKIFQEQKNFQLTHFLTCMFNQKKFKKTRILDGMYLEKNLLISFFLNIFYTSFSNFSLKLIFFNFSIKNILKVYLKNLFKKFKKPIFNNKYIKHTNFVKKKLRLYCFIIFFQSLLLMIFIQQFFLMMVFFDKTFFACLLLKKNIHPLKNSINFLIKSYVF
ncbi:hypothetical protein CMESO_550 (nucleomorph) [Chroomonas mesostigmatica CCMP1168]|uniref:Transmembrane protein n=1 Tax=Chroomonas mesostigmatica CCMP1168 TaxID=1195612 RepID=J7GB97_9CRYP|nr:hypothetical protein CMESO_550 [Chroomonas mesostigmatica CCMP1168]